MTPDDIRGYVSLLPYWAFGLALAGSFYKGMVWLGGHFAPQFRQDLTDWLRGEREKGWAENFCNLFDTLFGPRHLSLKRFLRSAIASVLAVAVLYVLFAHVLGVLGSRTLGTLELWQALGALVMVNIVADYVSLIETRWLLERFQQVRGVAGQAALLLADLVFTAAIVFLLLAAYGYLILGAVPRPIEVLALFSVYSIFFYSTFLTSVWAWLYCASSWFVRLFTNLGLGRIFDVTEPVRQIALVGAALIVLGSLTLGPLVRAEEGGLAARLDRWLCERDLQSCFLAARASLAGEDLGPIVMFMELACRDERDGGNCADRLDDFFGGDLQASTDIWARACAGGYARACRYFGWALDTGSGVPTNPERAADAYRQACDGGDALSCWFLGNIYEIGEGVAKNAAQAMVLHSQACEGGVTWGCTSLGYMYETGRGVAADAVRAVALYRQACDGGHALGCTNLGTMYATGQGVTTALPQAVALYSQACEGGEARGCTNLGFMYNTGQGVAEDSEIAVALYRLGCEMGNAGGCANLGVMYETGRGVLEDAGQALALYSQACEGGDDWACDHLGSWGQAGHGAASIFDRAAAFYHGQLCEAGEDWACDRLKALTGD